MLLLSGLSLSTDSCPFTYTQDTISVCHLVIRWYLYMSMYITVFIYNFCVNFILVFLMYIKLNWIHFHIFFCFWFDIRYPNVYTHHFDIFFNTDVICLSMKVLFYFVRILTLTRIPSKDLRMFTKWRTGPTTDVYKININK